MNHHKTVLLNEAIDGLEIKNGDIFVDGTLGGGGHSLEVAKRFGDAVVMIGIDLDPRAIKNAKELLEEFNPQINYVEDSFRNIDKIVNSLGIPLVDKILYDIGLSSNQFEESGRGFSFQKNEPLLMSFKENLTHNDLTAKEIVNNWDEENLEAIIFGYGEERYARKIAKAIVEARQRKKIETTFDLVEIIKSATPAFYHHRKIHPATRTFQALRITVNDEINSLKDGVTRGFGILKPSGRLAVISFHSLEDRFVKQFFVEKEKEGVGKRITKKPIVPGEEEIKQNLRSRSAKLRIIEKSKW